jgi:hypothetical protein
LFRRDVPDSRHLQVVASAGAQDKITAKIGSIRRPRPILDRYCVPPAVSDQNQVDYGHLVTRSVTGVVLDASGISIPAANIGVFTESAHELVFQTTSDSNGYFTIGKLARGEYRLVSQYNGLCPANARIVVAGWPQGGLFKSRTFYVRMVARGIDTCSWVTYNRPPNKPLQPTTERRGG